MSDHTPTPENQATEKAPLFSWNVDGDFYKPQVKVYDDGSVMMDVGGYCIKQPIKMWHRAANNFDRMLATLKLVFEEWPEKITPCYEEMKKAIAEAEKGKA